MTPLKWYQEIYLTVTITPLDWKLCAEIDRYWRTARLIIGPVAFHVGWPNLSKQTA